ncbi:MAG: cadmium-translocating P-type ATPase [Ruminococcaceae bacterium]|nr:cadmium-translocating P-type ATPase [Oscillospiraceae bacterium]
MTRKQKKNRNRIIAAVMLLAAAVAVEKLLFSAFPIPFRLLLYLPAYFIVGFDVLWSALRNILRGQVFDENFLMALATVGALAIGFLPETEPEFAEAVFVMIFYQVGELFQSIAVGKSRRSIAALMDIRPDTARVLRDGAELEVSPDEVAVGESILIRPGERIPLDGVILEGFSDMNTVALTGEAAPRAVAVGDEVISGCTNISGVLTVRVERVYGESTVARILSLMENAAAKKSKSERFITRFAKYYTPAVVVSAVLLALLPPLFGGDFGGTFPLWVSRALTFLVVSCPCALVISVPLSFFGGLGGASRFGVLIKGSTDLEALAEVGCVVFDKTGTLTEGSFTVTAVYPQNGTEKSLLQLAAAAEHHAAHPVAVALKKAVEGGLPVPQSTEEVPGRGVIATVLGKRVAVGNLLLMQQEGVDVTPVEASGTVLYVAADGAYLGAVVVSDTVKAGAGEALVVLRDAGVSRTVMLTGDREAAAAAVAGTLGVSEWKSELLPEDKVTAVEALLSAPHSGKIAFVGDGINDAPVLSRADVGIAMGALGSDAAIEAADVVLMDDDPRKIAVAVRHARRTLRIVRQNIVLALAIKGGVLLCSALGLLGAMQMPLAIFADVGVAVIAILNAMRTLKYRSKG